ncbi:MAG: ATP-binding protein [Armatimonadota bacterium]
MRIQNSTAVRIAIIYAVISAIWIITSDLVAASLLSGDALIRVSILKGWFFILVTALLLYILVRDAIAQILKTEAQFRLIFDSVNDGIYIFRISDNGMPGLFIDANEYAVNKLHYSIDEFKTMTPLQLIKPDMINEALPHLRKLIETGSAVFETVHVGKDGSEVTVEISSRVVRVDGTRIGANIVRDITERKREEAERRQEAMALEMDKRRFYRETILAVTGGKFELGEPEDAHRWIENPRFIVNLNDIEAFASIRSTITRDCIELGLPEDKALEFELGVGEALGNAVKHANGGEAYIGKRDGAVWVAIVDHGTGIDTFALPKVALLLGFSTKASMGLGYTMILAVSDHVKLATGPTGTIVLMEKTIESIDKIDQRIASHPGIV